jgi:tRNA dimethylallyltransferase
MNPVEKYLIVLGGATASGKTGLAIALAQHFKTAIVSADSRQIYQELNIGTAKPTAEELAAAKHYLVGHVSIQNDYNVGRFEQEAMHALNEIFSKQNIAILAGGTGLYLRAVCEGLDEYPTIDPQIRLDLEQLFAEEGIVALQNELKINDLAYFEKVDLNNPHRLIRALEICRGTGKPFSAFQKKQKEARPFKPIYILTDLDRAFLYEHINQRVDRMLATGLLEEARQYEPFRTLNALQTVGYQEFMDYFDGICDLKTAIDKVKQHTRNYAKRQVTWFKKETHWQRFHPLAVQDVIDFIQQSMTHK